MTVSCFGSGRPKTRWTHTSSTCPLPLKIDWAPISAKLSAVPRKPDCKRPRKESILDKILCGVRCVSNDVEQLKEKLALFMSKAGLATKNDLKKLETNIMASQAEVAAELRTVKTQIGKVQAEVISARDKLTAKITELEAIIAAGTAGEASAELVTIKDELKAVVQGLDDVTPDEVTPPVA